jgi:hypothetical protein
MFQFSCLCEESFQQCGVHHKSYIHCPAVNAYDYISCNACICAYIEFGCVIIYADQLRM